LRLKKAFSFFIFKEDLPDLPLLGATLTHTGRKTLSIFPQMMGVRSIWEAEKAAPSVSTLTSPSVLAVSGDKPWVFGEVGEPDRAHLRFVVSEGFTGSVTTPTKRLFISADPEGREGPWAESLTGSLIKTTPKKGKKKRTFLQTTLLPCRVLISYPISEVGVFLSAVRGGEKEEILISRNPRVEEVEVFFSMAKEPFFAVPEEKRMEVLMCFLGKKIPLPFLKRGAEVFLKNGIAVIKGEFSEWEKEEIRREKRIIETLPNTFVIHLPERRVIIKIKVGKREAGVPPSVFLYSEEKEEKIKIADKIEGVRKVYSPTVLRLKGKALMIYLP